MSNRVARDDLRLNYLPVRNPAASFTNLMPVLIAVIRNLSHARHLGPYSKLDSHSKLDSSF